MQDPKITFVNLLKNNWNNGNTSIASDPTIHTGWFDQQSKKYQITVTNPDEVAIDGGDTGYSGIAGDGTSPYQTFSGTVLTNTWTWRDPDDNTKPNPKKLGREFAEEIKRIIRANYDDATDLNVIAFMNANEIVETDKKPPVFRYECELGYIYREG